MILLGMAALLTPCYCIGAVLVILLLRSTPSNPPSPTVVLATSTPNIVANTAEVPPTLVPSQAPDVSTEALLPTPTQLVLFGTPAFGTPSDGSITNPNATPNLLTPPIAFASFTPVGQMPLCADFNGSTNLSIRADVPAGTASGARVYCRLITDKYQIGVASVISRGVLVAVDIFALNGSSSVTRFNNPIRVCLQGTGAFIFLDANQSPRSPQQLTSVNQNGYQCANVPSAGTVVLTAQ